MHKKDTAKKTAAALFIVIGISLLVSSSPGITGAFLGAADSGYSFLNSFLGFLLMVAGILVLVTSPSGLEKKITLSSSIKDHPGLLRLTKDAVRNPEVERDLNHLIEELGKGNLEAGLGGPGHVDNTDIFYLRGHNGGRLFYHKIENGYEIVGKASKSNENAAIKAIAKLYPRNTGNYR